MTSNRKIFLGGTCPSDTDAYDYRKDLIPDLKVNSIDYFNPVVQEWTEDSIRIEEIEKGLCDIHLYVITPNMKGVYTIAEMFGSLIKNYGSKKIVDFVLVRSIHSTDETWNPSLLKSLKAVGKLFRECGGRFIEMECSCEMHHIEYLYTKE